MNIIDISQNVGCDEKLMFDYKTNIQYRQLMLNELDLKFWNLAVKFRFMKMHTLIESIEDKYDGEDGRDYGFIVFVSSSPECRKGMFPPVMTLCDYDIETVGKF